MLGLAADLSIELPVDSMLETDPRERLRSTVLCRTLLFGSNAGFTGKGGGGTFGAAPDF